MPEVPLRRARSSAKSRVKYLLQEGNVGGSPCRHQTIALAGAGLPRGEASSHEGTPSGESPSRLLGISELVAKTGDGQDEVRVAGVTLDLGAQPADVHIQGARGARPLVAPHVSQQFRCLY